MANKDDWMKIDLQKAHVSGIKFIAEPRTPIGSMTIMLSPKEVMDWLNDPESVIEKHLRAKPGEYSLWLMSEGSVFCEAKTKKGKRCRNLVAETKPQLSFPEWSSLSRVGGYCVVHGEGR